MFLWLGWFTSSLLSSSVLIFIAIIEFFVSILSFMYAAKYLEYQIKDIVAYYAAMERKISASGKII
jgi:hypothetical protein